MLPYCIVLPINSLVTCCLYFRCRAVIEVQQFMCRLLLPVIKWHHLKWFTLNTSLERNPPLDALIDIIGLWCWMSSVSYTVIYFNPTFSWMTFNPLNKQATKVMPIPMCSGLLMLLQSGISASSPCTYADREKPVPSDSEWLTFKTSDVWENGIVL